MDNTPASNDPLQPNYNPIPASDGTNAPASSPDTGNPSTASATPSAPGAPATASPDPNANSNRMPMGPANPNRSVKPSAQAPAVDPQNPHANDQSVQNAGRFHSIAQALAGGQRYKIETDVNTGEVKRVPVPLNGKQIGMAIVLEALTGSLAGLAGGKGKGAGAAGLAGVNAGLRNVQQRREGEDAEFARQATISKTNMQMATNQRSLAEADRETHQKDVDTYASLYKTAQDANAIDKVVSEDEMHQMLTSGSLNVSKDQAIPIRVVPRMNPDGTPVKGQHGEALYQKVFALVKPNTQLTLPDDVKKILVDNKVQGYVDAQGKGINLPDDLEMRMHMIVDGIEKANTIRWAQESFDGYSHGQMNPLHKDTAPGSNTTSLPEIKDDKIASLIDAKAKKHGLDPALLRSLVVTESQGKPTAKSSKGAQGLGQLMPATAKAYGVTDPLDPEQNIEGSARFLKDLITERHGDVRGALIAYHGKGSDGITTGEQYADGILKRIGSDGSKADMPFKPIMSVSDALQQHVLTPKDLQVMQQTGGLSAFLNGNPKNGEMSSAQKMAQQHPDKVPPDSVGRIINFMGGQDAIDKVRASRMQYFQDQDENRAIDKARREAQNKQALDNESAEAMAKIVRGPDGFVLGKNIPNFADMGSDELQASLKSQGVQVPNNFDDLYAVAHYDVPASNLPQRLWRKGDPLAMSQQDGVSYIRKFLNPTFRQYEYNGRQKDWDAIMNPDSKIGQTVVNAGTAAQHLGMLKEASDALDKATALHGDVRALNQIANVFGVQIGKTPALTYTAIADKAADEVSKVAMGNAPFKEQVLATRAILTPANASQQTDEVIKAFTKLMYGRIKSIDDDTFKKQQKHLPNVSDDTTKLFQQYKLDVPWQDKQQAQQKPQQSQQQAQQPQQPPLTQLQVNAQTGQQIGWDGKQWVDVKTRQPYAP